MTESSHALVGLVHLVERECDRLSQIGVADSLGQQASERLGAKLTAVSGKAAQIVNSLEYAQGEPDNERPRMDGDSFLDRRQRVLPPDG